MNVLVIEDDPRIASLLEPELTKKRTSGVSLE
jgi:hypothetical protein